GSVHKGDACRYRDGLIIALLAGAPLRRGTLAALRVGEHLLKSGDLHPRITGLSASPAASCRPSHFRPSITQSGRVSPPSGGGAAGWPCGRWAATGAPATA